MLSIAPTWKNKVNADDTVIFGGDIAAAAGAANSWTNGAFSVERVAGGNYVEIDFTFDAKTSGHGIAVGFSSVDANQAYTSHLLTFVWELDNKLYVYESASNKASTAGVITLPMSCRIIIDLTLGTCVYRRNAGSDVLMHTSTLTAAQLRAIVEMGLQVDVAFWGNSGKLHVTLHADDGHIATPGMDFVDGATFTNNESNHALRVPQFSFGVDAAPPKLRPTAGKVWPRLS